MASEKRNFDKEAASWDEQPMRVKLANDIANAITQAVSLNAGMDVLDFGCGTGLLSMQLHHQLNSITGVDSSEGMLNMFSAKIDHQNITNIKVHCLDLDKGDTLSGNYHLIISSMTFHHIQDISHLLDQLYSVLHPSGILCIADLDEERGLFHDDNTGVFHFGFNRSQIQEQFTQAGFDVIQVDQSAEMTKPDRNGVMRTFSIFLIVGRKKDR